MSSVKSILEDGVNRMQTNSKFDINTLPLLREYKYNYSSILNGELFNFKVRYNSVAEKYFLSVFDSNFNTIRSGIAILPNRSFVIERVSPSGIFIVQEDYELVEGADSDPRFLVDRCTLLFINFK